MRLRKVALHFDALVFRDHAVHLAADLQPLELSSLRLKHGRDLDALAERFDVVLRTDQLRLQPADLLIVALQLIAVLRLALPEDCDLQGSRGVSAGRLVRRPGGFRREAVDLGLKAFHIRLQRAHIGPGEGRVEACQHLAGAHGLALAHVDRAHDRGLKRLHDVGRLKRHDTAGAGHHHIHRKQGGNSRRGENRRDNGPENAPGGRLDRRLKPAPRSGTQTRGAPVAWAGQPRLGPDRQLKRRSRLWPPGQRL